MRGMSATTLGIADLPMRLLVVSIVTSIAVPVVWAAYSDLSITMTQSSIEKELRDLFEVVESVMDGGVGTSLKVSMDISNWGSAGLDRVTIGTKMNTSSDPDRYVISYEIRGEGRSFISLDPPVAMLSDDGIILSNGDHELRLEHEVYLDEHICFVEIL
jgi:hypothetical protein